MTVQFIHLRVHTEYSLSDGLVQLEPLLAETAKQKTPAIAITDLANLFSVIKFYSAAIASGIKPIIGADIWLRNEKQPSQPFRLTLLCQNDCGYKNLLQLITKSYLEEQDHEKPQIHRDWLANAAEGIIVLSGAREGDVGQALLADDEPQAKNWLAFWLENFPNRYYLELQRTGRPQEENYLHAALELATAHSVPVVATNDVRFLTSEDFEAHEARVCIHEGRILADPRRPKLYSDQQYLRSQEEMQKLFADIPEALTNTVEIAKRCNVTLILGKSFLPRFPVPPNVTTEEYLSETAREGLEERLQICLDKNSPQFSELRKPYDERLQTELNVINKMGFAGYFLIVADFTRWARANGVPVGPGRGSGPGSLVAFALKITDLDPLAHDLLFERFLNPERVSMPDFDIDFCMEGRDRVIEYVMQTHGRDNVAQIITYGSMAARAVVRDVGRVLGLSYGFVDKIAKLIPFEIGMTLEKALEQEEALRQFYSSEEEVKTLIDLARKLEGLARNVGKHAGGVVIAPSKLTEFTPLYCEPGETHWITQFDKDDVEAVGLVKFDFLGLRTLTIIHLALQHINRLRQDQGEALLDINLLPMDDAATFTLLKACKTTAVFQLESRGMKDLIKRLQPDCFDDIVALVALFRPGPLQSGMVDDFINRKHGRAQVVYPHPKLEPILRPTYGVILYQEQVMQIAQVLAGYSLGSADLLRRAMGKKKPEEMARQRVTFCKGAEEGGVDPAIANHIFDLMEKFAGYGFNKSHSASYALIAYQTAWLKVHYPAAYMAAVLSSDMDHTEKVVIFIEECQALNLQLSPPDVNLSQYQFTVRDANHLVYGLGAIKGVGQAAIEAIIAARQAQGPFKDLFDFCQRNDLRKVNRRVLEALIKAGAFDRIGPHRASLMASLDHAIHTAEQASRDRNSGQTDLFAVIETHTTTASYRNISPWRDDERLFGEKETLGLYLTGHPINRYLNELAQFITSRIGDLSTANTSSALIGGLITNVRTLQTKRGDRMAVVTLDDCTGRIDAVVFAEAFNAARDLLLKDQLLIVEGDVSVDDFNDSYRLTAKKLLSMEQARERFAKRVLLNLNENPAQKIDLEKLAALLALHRGSCPIVFAYSRQDAKAELVLGESWCVTPRDSLLASLRELLSEDCIEVTY